MRKLRTLNTLTVNYFAALIFAFPIGYIGENGGNIEINIFYLLVFCAVVGAFFIGNFITYSKSVHTNGVGITIAAMRLSLMIPVLISIWLYAEYLSGGKLVGVVLVFAALLLLVPRKQGIRFRGMNASWLLVIVFLLSGFADASLKIYEEEFSMGLHELTFMGFVFTGAFIIGLVLCIVRSGPLITKKEFMLGAIIGIPNLYSSIFLIYALKGVSGAVAFPVVNILNVLGGTLLGLLFWSDKVSVKQWGGIITAIAAIVLLV
jgi:drug/metabolite transporter (DMT)-like permease